MSQTQALEPDENGEVPCPVCRDYHGKPESVEGHITGKSDEDHRGQIGKDYRCIQDGTRTLWTEPNPELKVVGTVSVLDEEYTVPESDEEELDNVTQSENDSEDRDDEDGIVAALVVALAIAVWWLARRTGTEDEVREVAVL